MSERESAEGCLAQIDEVVAMTRRMLEMAEQGDWLALAELEPKRLEQLQGALEGKVKAPEPVRERLMALQALDRRILKLTVAARQNLTAEMSELQKGRKGAKAYRTSSR